MNTVAHDRRVLSIIGRVREVAVLPQVVYQIIELTGNMAATAKDVERAVSVDPGMSARILTLANCAYYALPRKVTSIREAVVFLGFKTLRQLAMTVGCFDLFVGKADRDSLRRRAWWRHSIDTAICSKLVAGFVPSTLPEEAYAAGLMHDIGKSLLDRYGTEDYGRAEMMMREGVNPLEAEAAVFGCSHTTLGYAIGRHWRLPDALVEAIWGHHGINGSSESPATIAVVAVGNSLAHYIEAMKGADNATDNEPPLMLPEWAVSTANLAPETVEVAVQTCRAELDTSGTLSAIF